MPGKRVYELAGELNLSNKEVLDFLRSKKIDVKSHMSSLKENEEVMVRKALGSKEERKPVEKKETENREVQKRAGEETKAARKRKTLFPLYVRRMPQAKRQEILPKIRDRNRQEAAVRHARRVTVPRETARRAHRETVRQ